MYPKDLLKILQKNGWKIKRQRGSHVIIEKDNQIEVIPIHNKDLKPGILNDILKNTNIKI